MPRGHRKISLGISEYRVASAPDLLVTYGLGSCVGIVLYHARNGTAAVAHSLLPEPPSENDEKSAKYASSAVELMVEALAKKNCDPSGLVAKLAGGAAMFSTSYHSVSGGIGERNVAAARQALRQLNIPVVAEDVGGDYGRTIEFNIETGALTVRALQRPPKIL